MADKKISALTAATTPLDGTEVLPLVQSGTTVKVANNDLRPKQIQSNATSGVLQVAGPTAAATRVMTTPDANFTVARTDSAQSFSGLQTFASGVSVTSGKLTTTYGGGGDFISVFQNTSSSTPYGVWIKDAASSAAGYPLLIVSDSTGATSYFRVDSSNGDARVGIGNVVIGTSGKGIDFSATSGSGTSELLADYEEGTWTPVPVPTSGAITTYTSTGIYTKVGRQVTLTFNITISNAGTAVALSSITGIPFTNGGVVAPGCGREAGVTGAMWQYTIAASATSIVGKSYANDPSIVSGYILYGSVTYTV